MRNTSLTCRIAVNKQETDQVFTLLITFEHPNLATPFRTSSDNADVFELEGIQMRGTISNGIKYAYFPIEAVFPEDSEGSISQANLAVCNVSRDLILQFRQMAQSPTISMEVVLAATPNVREAYISGLKMVDITANALVIEGRLSMEHFLSEPYPGGSVLPSNFPGCF